MPEPPSMSLIERAAAVYGLDAVFRPQPVKTPGPALEDAASPAPPEGVALPGAEAQASPFAPIVPVSRERLRALGMIVPGAAPGALSEEFRIVKRQILLTAMGSAKAYPGPRGRLILVTSGRSGEGKTFCAANLALSMTAETDTEVLLVDADVAKPDMPGLFGIAADTGLMDALADPAIDPETLVVRTDIPGLALLPAGRHRHDDTELLASDRSRILLDRLADAHPRRVVILDSAPALAASPASVLALHVGQILVVVRADETTESELRETIALVDSGAEIKLLLNGVTFGATNRSFGSYYGTAP